MAASKLTNGIINKNNLMPLYILTWTIKWTKIGNKTIEKIIIILFLKSPNFDVKNLLSVFKKINNASSVIIRKMGNLSMKKLKKYDLGVLAVS